MNSANFDNSINQVSKTMMIAWVRDVLKKPPFPVSPREALLANKQPKQPGYYDGKYYKALQWKDFQNWHELESSLQEKLVKQWHKDTRIDGVSTLGGFNGKHWLCWVDFDVQDFDSVEAMKGAIASWLKCHPELWEAPHFVTPSGGHRFLVAFESEPENFGANNGFALTQNTDQRCGELLTKNGGHTLLPPTIGTNGKAYAWVKFAEYPPIVDSPESIGLFKLKDSKPQQQRRERPKQTYPNQKTWTDIDWARSYLEAIHPSRADDREQWIEIGMALHSVSDSLLPDWEDFSSSSSKFVPGECEKKWNGLKAGGSITIATLGDYAKRDGWESPFPKVDTPSTTSTKFDKVVTHPKFQPLDNADLLRRLDALIDQDLPQSELRLAINELASQSSYQTGEIWKLYRNRTDELERDREAEQAELDQILKAKSASINLRTILPPGLAEPIIKLASWLNLRPECYLTALLTGVSTLHHTQTQLILNEAWDFSVTPNLFSAIVAQSSQKKSPILKAMVTKPLQRLQAKAKERYQQELADYKFLLERYEQLKKEKKYDDLEAEFPDGKPTEPRQKLYYFTNATGEGIINQVAAHPDQGLLYLKDELAGIFKSFGQYKGGRGSEQEDLLSFYDGTGGTVLRASGTTADLHGLLLSIMGTIQPAVLQSLLKDFEDSNGNWARFMLVHQPLAASEMSEDGGKLDLTEMLASLYKKVDTLSTPSTFRLTQDAFKLFCQTYNRLEQRRCDVSTSAAMQNVWGKSEGRIGKLAINLHLIKAAWNDETPSEDIDKDTIKAAIELTNFYAQQVQALYTELEDGSTLSPMLAKVIEVAQRKDDFITAKEVQLTITKNKRPKPDQVRQWFTELVDMGKGITQGQGRKLKFKFQLSEIIKPPKVDKVDTKVDKVSTAETIDIQEAYLKVDKVDKVDTFQNYPPKPPNMEVSTTPADLKVDKVYTNGKNSNLSTLSTLSTNAQTTVSEEDTAVDTLSTQVSTFESTESTNSEVDRISHVKFDGEIFLVSQIEGNKFTLRRSGESRYIYARRTQLEITYKPQHEGESFVTEEYF
jgi:hypothetical protein